MKPYYKNELTTIYNGDCLEVMKQFDDNHFDLCLTDPPYGIGFDKGMSEKGGLAKRRIYTDEWDSFTPSLEYFNEIIRVSKKCIIFGGNHFTDKLPLGSHWIVWNKIGDVMEHSALGDCELAWTNINRKSVSLYTQVQQGFITHEKDRYHPTQKPIELFVDILKDYNKDNGLVLDCFAGSFTTSIACEKLGMKSISIEKLKKYCDVGVKRLSQLQMRLDI
jgi:site-specific DNA-methyltransferase (adenine-specific)